MIITSEFLRAQGWVQWKEWAEILRPVLSKYNITSPSRVAMFIANTGHESAGGKFLVENLNYKPEALLAVWPSKFTPDYAQEVGRTSSHPADQAAIAEAAYGGRMGNIYPGDGWKFRGRGLMQTTGRDNYTRLAKIVNKPVDDVVCWLETKEGAAESAGAFWFWADCNKHADVPDIERCRRLINGGLNGIDDVKARYQKAILTPA